MTSVTLRVRTTAAALAVLLTLSACGTAASFPDREPDARGMLASYDYDPTATYEPGTAFFHLTVEEDEYSYFNDAVLFIDDDTVIATQTGESLGIDGLSVGVWVEVWTDACAESYPVQCGLTHVRLTQVD